MSLVEGFITAINDEIKAIEKRGATKNIVLKNGEFIEKTQQGYICIKILEKAYLECRYPVPNPIHKNYLVKTKGLIIIYDSPLGSTKLRKFAYEVGLKIIEKIEKDFNMIIPREKFSTKINDEDWIRFRRIFFNDI